MTLRRKFRPIIGERSRAGSVGALHQMGYALGGGLAGLLATRQRSRRARRAVIAAGLTGGGLAALAVGYGTAPAVTVAGASVMSLFGTSALIRLWAALADLHGAWWPIAMSEGEVSVSRAGILPHS